MNWVGTSLVVLGCVMLREGTAWADDPVGPEPVTMQATSLRNWALKLPKDHKVVFSGAHEYAGASASSNSILYPAPNAAVFLVSVITHGLLVESQKNSQRKQAQESADRVLEPYQPILKTLSYRQLAQPWADNTLSGSTKRLLGDAELPGSNDWLVEITPAFLMTQSQRTLILDALVTIRAPNDTGGSGYQNRIRVISQAEEGEDPVEMWTIDQGKKLKEISAWLFTESLNIAIKTLLPGNVNTDQPFRTIRYLEGAAEKMERAQLISEHCGRLLIKTLRGVLMSVPAKASIPCVGTLPETAFAKS